MSKEQVVHLPREGGVRVSQDATEVGEIRRRARADADRVLSEHWRSGTLPVDPRAIVAAVDARLAGVGERAGGSLATSSAGAGSSSRGRRSLVRSRFESARLLGLRTRDRVAGSEPRPSSATGWRHRTHPDEIYANEFAVALLLPHTDFVAARSDGLDDLGLAKRFQVSPTIARWRALQLDCAVAVP
ncbi:ImmA/IrrE family metallo-endopeptidase [Nocardioides albidus]|uniref:ImmA/IrrE family metallo-endopeptidase n=1 Tax=Nocardioides albidus TaxID=1517589 RepID=UPI0013052B74|nr:ImmA/IrrE family metallo-endopeptidase [Nocardioides albidus]